MKIVSFNKFVFNMAFFDINAIWSRLLGRIGSNSFRATSVEEPNSYVIMSWIPSSKGENISNPLVYGGSFNKHSF